MSYPANCIRGIRSKQDIYNDRQVAPGAFQFKKNNERQDGFLEVSVNWEDDASVSNFTLNQKKGNSEEFEFKAGYAVVSLDRLCYILEHFLTAGQVAYERRLVNGKPLSWEFAAQGFPRQAD